MKSLTNGGLLSLLALAAACLLLATGTAVAQNSSALGDDGIVYSVQAGSYGELFPEGSATDADDVVLRLLVNRGEQGVERYLVPATETDAVEVGPSLLVEDATGVVYLLWESWSGLIHSSIYLTSLGEHGWTEPIEVTGAPFVFKSSPRVLVTRDEISWPDAKGLRESHQQTLLHLAWVENGAAADERIVYSPLLLLNGRYVTAGRSVVLNDLVPPADPAAATSAGGELGEPLLTLRPGEDPQSVVIAFSDRRSRRLVSLDLRVLPGEISYLADRLYELILGRGAGATGTSESLATLAGLARSEVETYGVYLQPLLRDELASRIYQFIAAQEPGIALGALADATREHFLGDGSDLVEPGIQRIIDNERPHWVDFGYTPHPAPPGAAEQRRSYQVTSRVASERPTPGVIQDDGVEIMVSKDGEALALVWQQGDDEIFYQESDAAGGWGQANRLRLSAGISPEMTRQLVQDRIDKR